MRNMTRYEYTDLEIEAGWTRDGQGHNQAVARGIACVIQPCDRETAILLSRLFLREFALTTCCHYDGETLSMYCGEAGRGCDDLIARIKGIMIGFLAQSSEDSGGK